MNTHVKTTSQLVVFIFCCKSNFIITDEFLEWIPMHETIIVETFCCEKDYYNSMNIHLSNLCALWLVDLRLLQVPRKNEIMVIKSNCVMQQEVLCSKIISLVDIWKPVVLIVNFVKPGDFFMDRLLLFFLTLTMNMRIWHI
jgi:hypothetical protein